MSHSSRIPVGFVRDRSGTIIGAVAFLGKPVYSPSAEELNSALRAVDERYRKLVAEVREGRNLVEALDEFLSKVSDYVLVGRGFIECLAKDVRLSRASIAKSLLSTEYMSRLFTSIKENQYKRKKSDPVAYAEACTQLVDLFGFERASRLLERAGIRLKPDTLKRLHKVGLMPLEVKQAIREGKIPLTLAFQLPLLNEEDLKSILEKISGLSRAEAKKKLKEMLSRS